MDLLAVQVTLRSLLQHHSLIKALISLYYFQILDLGNVDTEDNDNVDSDDNKS